MRFLSTFENLESPYLKYRPLYLDLKDIIQDLEDESGFISFIKPYQELLINTSGHITIRGGRTPLISQSLEEDGIITIPFLSNLPPNKGIDKKYIKKSIRQILNYLESGGYYYRLKNGTTGKNIEIGEIEDLPRIKIVIKI
jgi:hypothetical protein